MGWLDKVKQTMEKAAGDAEDMAAAGKLRLEIRTLKHRAQLDALDE